MASPVFVPLRPRYQDLEADEIDLAEWKHKERMPSSLSTYYNRLSRLLPQSVASLWHRDGHAYTNISVPKWRRWGWGWNRILVLPHLLIMVWLVLLFWGERWVFWSAVRDCEWSSWEQWPKEAMPHHLIFLADPQLIDPHSYPGRPWPLSDLTMLHTDNYMKRSYIALQKTLHPDTVFFLGDLFDGGREWKRAHGNTVDQSWANGQRPSGEQAFVETWGKRYGEDFWLKEYDRFGRIFYKFWDIGGAEPGPGQRGRKIISSLPGNHDLGFGENIKTEIRNRFETYFGEGNRVDVIGNHTIVSVDTVSLSAGASTHDTKAITQPVEDFLAKVQVKKRMAVAHELAYQQGMERIFKYKHIVADLDLVDFETLPTLDPGPSAPDFPTILLTHVPLYRGVGTPCGPQREHWPPTKPPKGQTKSVFPDERNAISISRGYQYQNVLSESDSVKLVTSIGNVVRVFSGDDHDYCEIVHSKEKDNVREITVKSMSWAMGVRKPGFLLLSMWNPIGPDGQPLPLTHTGHESEGVAAATVQSHLCLLPDQLGILFRYLGFLIVSLLVLIIRAILTPVLGLTPFASSSSTTLDEPSILPTTRKREPDRDHYRSSNTTSTPSNGTTLAPRTNTTRTRSVSPSKGYGLPASEVRYATPPLINQAGYYPSNEKRDSNGWAKADEYQNGVTAFAKSKKPTTPLGIVWREMRTSIWRVVWVVISVYLWLAYFFPA